MALGATSLSPQQGSRSRSSDTQAGGSLTPCSLFPPPQPFTALGFTLLLGKELGQGPGMAPVAITAVT